MIFVHHQVQTMVSHEGMTEHGNEFLATQVRIYYLYSIDNLAAYICIVSLQAISILFSLGKSFCEALIPYAGLF